MGSRCSLFLLSQVVCLHLCCSFLFLASTFSGLSIAFDPTSCQTRGLNRQKRRGFVVRTGKEAALGQTKRSRSRKSLARTHGFRRSMGTTSGRATIKRRRARRRGNLCPKSKVLSCETLEHLPDKV